MEGIFILKIVGDTTVEKFTKTPYLEIQSILNSFSDKGYPFSTILLLEAYRISDTFYLIYKLEKNNFYIIKNILVENYYSKSFVYKKFLKSFENKIYSESLLNSKLYKLDKFYNLKSSKTLSESYLKVKNEKFPIEGFGSLTLSDSSINGNINFSFDFINLIYNRNFLNGGIEIALPLNFFNKIGFRYSKFLQYNNLEGFLNLNNYIIGIKNLNKKTGIFIGYQTEKFIIRIDALDFFYKSSLKFTYNILTFETSLNQIDKNLIGGYENILGYLDNSIICNNYALISLNYNWLIFYPILQIYWIDKSQTLYSYGIGFGNQNAKIFFIINGRERKPYLHLIIKS